MAKIPPRSQRASDALARLRAAAPEMRAQAYDAWLYVATAGEVRRHWRRWMGRRPGWAPALRAAVAAP
jgi:hypothetical protein